MDYEIPETVFNPAAQFTAPLVSIVTVDKDGTHRRVPERVLLGECERQARIARMHLDRLWALVDKSAKPDETEVWAEVQGAMTAGIILSRMLKPAMVYQRPPLSRNRSKKRSDERGEDLRKRLRVEDDSPLLTIADVRHPIEHIDERLDTLVEDWTAAISDFFIAQEGYLDTGVREFQGRKAYPSAALRIFAPWPGLLIFGEKVFDLFAFEEALHRLVEVDYPNALKDVITSEEPGKKTYIMGSTQHRSWQAHRVAPRRERWEAFRASRDLPAPGGSQG